MIAKKSQFNKFGGYAYRSAEDILESVKPLLKDNECVLTLSDDIQLVGDRYYIKAIAKITNKDGASVETVGFAREALTQKGMSDAQITGGSSSYARKYALNGLFSIAENDDIDSVATHGKEKTVAKAKTTSNDW